MTARTWTGVWLLACLVGTSCTTSHPPAADGQSNWLMVCESDDECSVGACVCGVCTVTCDEDDECARAGGPDAACVDPARDGIAVACAATVIEGHAGICLAACASSSDCPGMAQCMDGACIHPGEATGGSIVCEEGAGCGAAPWDGGPAHEPVGEPGWIDASAELEPGELAPRNEDPPAPVVEPPGDPVTPAPSDTTDAGSPASGIDAGGDAGIPPGIDAGSALATCEATSSATWSEPIVLASVDDAYGFSAFVGPDGRMMATFMEHDWSPQGGAYEFFLRATEYAADTGWSPFTTLTSVTGGGWASSARTVLNDDRVGFAVWMEGPVWNQGAGVLMARRYDGASWEATPTVVSPVDAGTATHAVGLGVDAAGNAWLVWRPDATQIVGSRFASSAGTWSAPIVLALGQPGPNDRPALHMDADGDAVLYWATPSAHWGRHFQDGVWLSPASIPNQNEIHLFAFGGGTGLNWLNEATGNPEEPYRGRIRRFHAETGWDVGFTIPHHPYYGGLLVADGAGTALGVFADEAARWTAFEVPSGGQGAEGETVVLSPNDPAVMPGYAINGGTLAQHPSGAAIMVLGLEWSSGGPTDARQSWGRTYCATVGWSGLAKISGTFEASNVLAAAVNERGQSVALLAGTTGLLAAVLE